MWSSNIHDRSELNSGVLFVHFLLIKINSNHAQKLSRTSKRCTQNTYLVNISIPDVLSIEDVRNRVVSALQQGLKKCIVYFVFKPRVSTLWESIWCMLGCASDMSTGWVSTCTCFADRQCGIINAAIICILLPKIDFVSHKTLVDAGEKGVVRLKSVQWIIQFRYCYRLKGCSSRCTALRCCR